MSVSLKHLCAAPLFLLASISNVFHSIAFDPDIIKQSKMLGKKLRWKISLMNLPVW